MTPKEKAKDLVEKFEVSDMQCENIHLAMLCVEEIIQEHETLKKYDRYDNAKFWYQVKQELLNL